MKGAEEIIPVLKKLTHFAQEKNIPILSSVDTHTEDDPEFKDFPPHCIKGTQGHKKIQETLLESYVVVENRPLDEDFTVFPQILIEKSRFSLFDNFNVERILKAFSPREVVCYGVATDYCVRAAVLGFLERSIKVVVLEDAVRAVDPEAGSHAMSEMRSRGALISTSQVVFDKILNGSLL